MAHANSTRRERTVNWGDKMSLSGRTRTSLAWVSVEEPSPMTVYATAAVRGGTPSAGVTAMVRIEWGNGGASIEHDYPLIHRLRVPLAASMVNVSGWLVHASGTPVPPDVSRDISVFIARGNDGETLRNTRWVGQYGASGELSPGPARVMRIEGFNAGPDAWLMVFDGAPVVGAFPAVARPVRSGRTFVIRRSDSQGFRNAVMWAASAAPDTFAPLAGARLRVDAEFLL